jgi:hypothetical protein
MEETPNFCRFLSMQRKGLRGLRKIFRHRPPCIVDGTMASSAGWVVR